MKNFTLKETLLLAAAAGFFIIWLIELRNPAVSWKDSYFWAMFSVGCLLWFQYTKNERLGKK